MHSRRRAEEAPLQRQAVLGTPQSWRRDFSIAGLILSLATLALQHQLFLFLSTGVWEVTALGVLWHCLPSLALAIVLIPATAHLGVCLHERLNRWRGERSLLWITGAVSIYSGAWGAVSIGLPLGALNLIRDALGAGLFEYDWFARVAALIWLVDLNYQLVFSVATGSGIGAICGAAVWFPYVWTRVLDRPRWPTAVMFIMISLLAFGGIAAL